MIRRLNNVQKRDASHSGFALLDRAPLFFRNIMYIIIDEIDEINIGEDKVLLLPVHVHFFFRLDNMIYRYKSNFYFYFY